MTSILNKLLAIYSKKNFLKIGIIQFSPFDMLIYLRIILLITMWEILSLDFSGIEHVAHYSTPLFAYDPKWLFDFLTKMQPVFFGYNHSTIYFPTLPLFAFCILIPWRNIFAQNIKYFLILCTENLIIQQSTLHPLLSRKNPFDVFCCSAASLLSCKSWSGQKNAPVNN